MQCRSWLEASVLLFFSVAYFWSKTTEEEQNDADIFIDSKALTAISKEPMRKKIRKCCSLTDVAFAMVKIDNTIRCFVRALFLAVLVRSHRKHTKLLIFSLDLERASSI